MGKWITTVGVVLVTDPLGRYSGFIATVFTDLFQLQMW